MLPVSKEIPETREGEPEFRIRPGPDLSGDHTRRPKRGARGVGNPRKMFGLGSAAEQDTEAFLPLRLVAGAMPEHFHQPQRECLAAA